MKKFFVILFFALPFTFLIASEKKEPKMTQKLIQIEVITKESSKDLETDANKFLVSSKMTRSKLIDIKYCRANGYMSALVIYEVDLEEEK